MDNIEASSESQVVENNNSTADVSTEVVSDNNTNKNVDNNWISSLPQEYQEKMKKFSSPEDVVKSYIHLESLIGKKAKDLSEQDKEVYASLYGSETFIPESPDKYEIDYSPAEGCDPVLIDSDLEILKERFHSKKFNSDQAQEVIDILNDAGNAILSNHKEQLKQQEIKKIESISKSWGNAWKTKLNDVNNCIEKILPGMINYTPDQLKKEFKHAGPATLEALAALGSLNRDRSSGYNNFSPNDATMSLDHIKQDPEIEKIIANRWHPKHKEIMDRISTLSKLKHNEM